MLQNTDTGGLVSFFSTLGPTYEVDFKPNVCGVGGHIVSTFLANSWAIAQGTSMAGWCLPPFFPRLLVHPLLSCQLRMSLVLPP